MTIENEVFQRTRCHFDRLISYGFIQSDNQYQYQSQLVDGDFDVIIIIDETGHVHGHLYDHDSQEEYILFRLAKQSGDYVSRVKREYLDILNDMKDRCFYHVDFYANQANRISQWIDETYHCLPDFPWDEKPNQTSAVFRHQDSGKWFALIMEIERCKVDKSDDHDVINAMNVKIDKNKKDELLKEKGLYQGYHMNHQWWITIILDETVDDQRVQQLLQQSFLLTKGK